MKVVVCVKQIPDPATPGQLDPASHRLRRDGEEVLDPGDQYGVEAALQLVEANGGEVVVVSMGPDRAMDAVRKALAMGAGSGILVTDPTLEGSDALTTAKVLAAAARRAEPDLVVMATESTDGYSGVVPQMVAELLGLPALTFAKQIELVGTTLTIQRQTEVGSDRVETSLPALVSVTASVNEPRYPSLKGIMGAKSKPVEKLTLTDLGLVDVGGAAAGQIIERVTPAEQRAAGEIIPDSDEAVSRLADFLANQKVL